MLPLFPWLLAALSTALLAGAGALWWRRRQRSGARALPGEWALTARLVFNVDERRLYRHMRGALPNHVVLSKLPLVRFCQPTDPQRVAYWYELLGSTHVSFAVCNGNGRVLAAIDLVGDRNSSRRSAQIKKSVLDACRVRYLRCAPQQLPSIAELQLLVPPVAAASRGPVSAASAQVRDLLATTVANRRRERTTQWQDSSYLQDSFFGNEQRADFAASSSFGVTRPPDLPAGEPSSPEEPVGSVIETQRTLLRH